jgi:hypothetical protein
MFHNRAIIQAVYETKSQTDALAIRISGNDATDLPCDISLGAGIDHSVAVDGKVVVVLFLALLVRRHSKEQKRVKGWLHLNAVR